MSNTPKTLYIVDGSGEVWRAYHAFKRSNLRTSTGFPTGALFGFTQVLNRLLSKHNPDYIAITFDKGRKTFRHDIYPDYKATRNDAPDELVVQMPRVRDIVRAFNIPLLEQENIEADDLIATMTKRAVADGLHVVIVSNDKDLMQLVDDDTGVSMFTTRKKGRKDTLQDDGLIHNDDVVERWGVPPKLVGDLLALQGDTSDNIPGVPGIGQKTAAALLDEFGSLEGILANTSTIKAKKRRQNLEEYADQARLASRLVTLKDDCDIQFDLEHLKHTPPIYKEIIQLFEEFEFYRMIRDLEQHASRYGVSLDVDPAPEKTYRGVFDLTELEADIERIRRAGLCAVDLETNSLDPHTANIVGISLAWKDHAGVYIPTGHTAEPDAQQQDMFSAPATTSDTPSQLPLQTVLDTLRPILEDASIAKVGQNIKFDWLILKRHGVDIHGVACDAMLASYVLDPSRESHGMDYLARTQLRYETKKFEDVVGKGRKKKTFDQVSIEEAIPYAAEDADITRLLASTLTPQLEANPELLRVFRDFEMPLWKVLGRMELHGILTDRSVLDTLSKQFTAELNDLRTQIFDLAGHEFNLDSPQQLAVVLFDELGLPVQKSNKSGPSTNQAVLEALAPLHPIAPLISEYRSFSKLISTYVDALPALIDSNGRIHTSFRQALTATGRLSSANPNLQNIPARTPRGRAIRKAFVAPPGWSIMAADYSQIELRILAHMSEDPALLDAFTKGEDVHRRTASEIFDIAPEDVTREQRGAGKTINFGVIYGMGARSLAKDLDIEESDAKAYIEAYFDRYTGVRDFFETILEDTRSTGYAQTLFGRRRPVPELASSRSHLRAYGERLATNTPIQGTAADLIKKAMIDVQRRIDEDGWNAHMLLQVHDELVFEVQDEQLADFTALVVETMANVADLKVPLIVEAESGKSWYDAK